MSYKLVCIDMDGTLLNSKREISERTKAALKKADALGVHIVISTGRIYSNAAFYSDLLGVKSPVIASNGAFVREKDNDKVIYKCAIESNTGINIINLCEKLNIRANFFTPYGSYGNSKLFYFIMKRYIQNEAKEPISTKLMVSFGKLREYFANNEGNVIKFEVVHRDPEKIKLLREALTEIEDIEISWSSRRNIEITKKGVSKGHAVKQLAQYYNITREEIIAIGDSENDITMLEYAGLGVAMGNALDRVKQKADYVTDTNDYDGVAKVIEKYVVS